MDGSSPSRRSPFMGHVSRSQCVRFPLFESVSRLDVRITDHGHVVGLRLVCLSSFLARAFLRTLHTRHLRVARTTPQGQNTQSDRTNISFHDHRGHPSRTRDVSHLSWMCSRRFVSHHVEHGCSPVTSVPITSTVRLLSSSFVFVGGFVCKRSVPHWERPSSRTTRTLG